MKTATTIEPRDVAALRRLHETLGKLLAALPAPKPPGAPRKRVRVETVAGAPTTA